MHIHQPILIIGQGIAGTLLSYILYREQIPFVVMDMPSGHSTSHTSGAVLNPYSGKTRQGIARRSDMYDTAINIYREMEQLLAVPVIQDSSLVFFDSEREAHPAAADQFRQWFQHYDTVHVCERVAIIHNEILLDSWRRFLREKGLLLETVYDESALVIKADHMIYKGQEYHAVIYCNGVQARVSQYFEHLRFTRNRGDVLHLHIEGLPEQIIFNKDKIRLIPRGNNLYWCGSNYNWHFEDMHPDPEWRAATIATLEDWLQLPFTLQRHLCAERPTTVGQLPFVGWHPLYPRIGICNGLGTKGFSAGPEWIQDFVAQMLQGGQTKYQSVLDKYLS